MIIGLVGKRGTGKDTVANYLTEKHGFRAIDINGDILTPILEKQGVPVTRDNLIDLAMSRRKETHNGIWAEEAAKWVKINKPGDYAIAGVRFVEEVGVFRREFGGDFVLISFVTDDDIRYERCRKRGTKGEGGMTFEQFMAREKKPTEVAIVKAVGLADYAVDNNGTPEQLFTEVERIVKLLKGKS